MTATVRSSVGKLNLEVDQGATFDTTLTWRNAAGDLVDLTNFTAQMQIRQHVTSTAYTLELTEAAGTTLGGVLGTVQITITSTQTAAIVAGSYVYDLELTSAGGVVTRLVGGCVKVKAEVTR